MATIVMCGKCTEIKGYENATWNMIGEIMCVNKDHIATMVERCPKCDCVVIIKQYTPNVSPTEKQMTLKEIKEYINAGNPKEINYEELVKNE